MQNEATIILSHRKSTRVDGVGKLVALFFFGALFGLLMYFTLPSLRSLDTSFMVGFFGILGLVCLAFLFQATQDIWARREFVCELTELEIRCAGATWGSGTNFRLSLDDIARIERSPHDSDVEHYTLRDRAGRGYWLTTNYENPAWRFVAEIRSLRPEIEEIAT